MKPYGLMLRPFGVIATLAGLAACRPQPTSTPPVEDSRPKVTSSKTHVASKSSRTPTPTAPRDPGAQVYADHCQECHGALDQGTPRGRANDLANQDFLATASDAFLLAAVERGRPGTEMPAYRGNDPRLRGEQIRTVVEYIRSWQTEPTVELSDTPVRGDPKIGKKLYASRCAGCHGVLGQGAKAMSLNNPVFLETVSDGYLRYAIVNGRRNTAMEAYGNKLSAQQIDHVVAVIRSWQPTKGPSPRES